MFRAAKHAEHPALKPFTTTSDNAGRTAASRAPLNNQPNGCANTAGSGELGSTHVHATTTKYAARKAGSAWRPCKQSEVYNLKT